MLSNRLKTQKKNQELQALLPLTLYALEGTQLNAPKHFTPDPVALAYHRDVAFRRVVRHAGGQSGHFNFGVTLQPAPSCFVASAPLSWCH